MSDFLEITCKSSGKVRRFSVGTEASFALQLINQKLDSVDPSALYIEAIKQGEEPISFGPNSVLIDYGDGWKLQTVTRQGSHRQKAMEEFPTAIEPASGDVHSATDVHLDLLEPPLQDESRPITSEPVSDVESQSLEKLDFTDTFKTDVTRKQVFNSRDELIRWARDLGKSIGMVVVIKRSDVGSSGRVPRVFMACERFGKKSEHPFTKKAQKMSKGFNCPFLLRGLKMPKDDQWVVKVECGHHNHPLGPLQGSFAGRLNSEEKEIVVQMLRAGIKPKEILQVLKDRDEHSESTIHTIYNTQARHAQVPQLQKTWILKNKPLSTMAEGEQVANNESPPQQQQTILQLPHQFLEIYCKCSGKVRRFSVGTEASFALQLINKKLGHGVPSALYIEAIKEGEEPITFGPNSVLIDYGDGWKLETVTNEGSEIQNEYDYKELPDIIEPARDDVQSATDLEFHLTDLPLQDENMPVTSEPISDIESQSLRKLDFTDAFTTDVVFNCRDELVTWARDVGRSVGMVVIIKKSEFGASGRSSRIFLACERFGKRREYKVPFKKKTSAPSRRVSKGKVKTRRDVSNIPDGIRRNGHNIPVGIRRNGCSIPFETRRNVCSIPMQQFLIKLILY
ncbi:hypothetical protein IFM89_003458 [Coptis chinensis]|uniref:Uncharacterized protein n=1 Tax=Coptis chinensis TaxID=261450 RepID=A0A835HAG6_9MAGN|nr:hypothetical protein IFM89_003458 [Coptis chinensis]